MDNIYNIDWFRNRNRLGKYMFDKSGAIFDFNSQAVCKSIYDKTEIDKILSDVSVLQNEFNGIAKVILKTVPTITITSKDKNYTDFTQIVVSGQPLSKIPGPRAIDVIYGCLVHECSHIRYTQNLSRLNKISKFGHWIWNLLEDELIEQKLQNEFPGFGNFLGATKDYMFGSKEIPTSFDSEINEISYILFHIVRYPISLTKIDESILDKHIGTFNKIKDICAKYDLFDEYSTQASATSKTYYAAKEICKLLSENLDTSSMTGQGIPTDTGGDHSQISEQDEGNEIAIDVPDGSMIDSNPNETEDLGDFSQEMMSAITSRMTKILAIAEDFTDDEYHGSRGTDPNINLYNIKPRSIGRPEKYRRIVNSMRKSIEIAKKIYVPIKKSSKDKLTKESYKRNGTLDPRLLPLAMQNNQCVYNRSHIVKTNEKASKFALVIVIDESGSMNSSEIYAQCDNIAIALTEAFKTNPDIELYVYGYGDYVTRYVTPTTKDYTILANRMKSGGQNECIAYRTILREVKSKTSSNILFMTITDSKYLSSTKDMIMALKTEESKRVIMTNVTINFIKSHRKASDFTFNDNCYGKDGWVISNSSSSKEGKRVMREITQIINRRSRALLK